MTSLSEKEDIIEFLESVINGLKHGKKPERLHLFEEVLNEPDRTCCVITIHQYTKKEPACPL